MSLQQSARFGTRPTSDLRPHYRQLLTLADLLDETFTIYRRAWLPMLGIMAAVAVPFALLAIGLLLAGLTPSTNAVLNPGVTAAEDPAAITQAFTGATAAGGLLGVLEAVFLLVAAAGVVALTDWFVRGDELSVGAALRVGLGRLLPLLGSMVLLFLFEIVLTVASVLLMIVTLGGIFFLVPLVILVVWLANPGARRPVLKWALILTTPFGLALYYGVRLWLGLPAIVLERQGPLSSLRRSAQLVSSNWFRVFGILAVLGIITSILESLPTYVVGAVGAIFAIRSVLDNPDQVPASVQAFAAATYAASALGTILFGSVISIGMTLLFVDLRNRREGADIAEQVARLEAESPTSTSAFAPSGL